MPDKVRLALVMNGGVSLAVWMGGVTHEIDRLRRATADTPDAWGAVVKAAGQLIAVDLIAGTSAGGLNGAILATAIARGAALPPLRDMWRTRARLLPGKLSFNGTPKSPLSILDGEFFRKALQEVFDGMSKGQPGSEDVTLLLTSSALAGSSRAVIDAAGSAFTAGDHRRVFLFRKRKGARTWHGQSNSIVDSPIDDFDSNSVQVALAARASAGFPFAFAPVLETDALHRLDVVKADGVPAWLIDGGVLDNAPFGPLLDELTERPRRDAGPRWVVYVVPHTDVPVSPPLADPDPQPPGWSSVLGRVVSLSRESDLRADVDAVRQRHQEAHKTIARPDELLQSGLPGLTWDAAAGLARDLLTVYRRTTATETVTDILLRQDTIRVADQPIDPLDVDTMLALAPYWIPETLSQTRPIGGSDQWQWGVGRAIEMTTWISRVVRQLAAPDVSGEFALLQEDLLAIGDAIGAIRTRVFGTPDPIGGNITAFNAAVTDSALLVRLTATMHEVIAKWAAVAGITPQDCVQRLLTVEVLSRCLSWGASSATPPFDLFLLGPATPAGPWLKPHDTRPSLTELDGWPNLKLYGDRFVNFGAFGSDSFKDWDWMWGRLDGALTLARALLPPELPEDETENMLNALVDEILADCGTDRVAVYTRCVDVLAMRPSALIVAARNSGETDVDGLIDDAAAMLLNVPLLTSRPQGLRRRLIQGSLQRLTRGVAGGLAALIKAWVRAL